LSDLSLHETYMQRCLDLALLGIGTTAPNPMVGSVVVHQLKIIGEGYHHRFGGNHAEVNAIDSVSDKSLLRESTLYVNLEPCSHLGKTPPCADMIIKTGIPRVVIGTADPNPVVAGNGIQRLVNSGVEVISDILKEQCLFLNRRFFTFHNHKRPYIILKWAQTSDGFIDILRDRQTVAEPTWISNELSRMLVHKWRAEEDAILVGTNTALKDNPRLNLREWTGKQPLRLVIDRKLTLPDDLQVFNPSSPVIIFNQVKQGVQGNIRYILLPFDRLLSAMMNFLYHEGIQSVIVEGGLMTLDGFIRDNLWDEARVFTGQKLFGKGVPAPEIKGIKPISSLIRQDLICFFFNDRKTD